MEGVLVSLGVVDSVTMALLVGVQDAVFVFEDVTV